MTLELTEEFTEEAQAALTEYLSTRCMWPSGALRSIADIQADLKQEIPKEYLEERKQGGAKLTYWPWQVGVMFFDAFAPGWDWMIDGIVFSPVASIHPSGWKEVEDKYKGTTALVGLTSSLHVAVWGHIVIPCLENLNPGVKRAGSGGDYEHEDNAKRSLGFDPVLDSERQAMKRAMSNFGFGLYLYDKK